MKNRYHKILKFLFLVCFTLASVACGERGFKSESLLGQTPAQPTPPTPPGPAPVPGGDDQNEDSKKNRDFLNHPDLLAFKGFINGGPANDKLAVDLDLPNEAILIDVPLIIPYLTMPEGIMNLKDLSGAKIYTYTDVGLRSHLVLSVPLKYLVKGVDFLNKGRLPNGDPLPGIPSGELPSLSIRLPFADNSEVRLYIGVTVIAIFVTSKVDPYIPMTFLVRNKEQTKIIGSFSLIPEKNAYSGGLFLAAAFTDEVARVLEEYL